MHGAEYTTLINTDELFSDACFGVQGDYLVNAADEDHNVIYLRIEVEGDRHETTYYDVLIKQEDGSWRQVDALSGYHLEDDPGK